MTWTVEHIIRTHRQSSVLTSLSRVLVCAFVTADVAPEMMCFIKRPSREINLLMRVLLHQVVKFAKVHKIL